MQGQEGRASHGDTAVLCLLLKHGEMGKGLFCLSLYPMYMQLFPPSVCVPFLNTYTQIKAVLARGRMKDWKRIFISLLGSAAAEKVLIFITIA